MHTHWPRNRTARAKDVPDLSDNSLDLLRALQSAFRSPRMPYIHSGTDLDIALIESIAGANDLTPTEVFEMIADFYPDVNRSLIVSRQDRVTREPAAMPGRLDETAAGKVEMAKGFKALAVTLAVGAIMTLATASDSAPLGIENARFAGLHKSTVASVESYRGRADTFGTRIVSRVGPDRRGSAQTLARSPVPMQLGKIQAASLCLLAAGTNLGLGAVTSSLCRSGLGGWQDRTKDVAGQSGAQGNGERDERWSEAAAAESVLADLAGGLNGLMPRDAAWGGLATANAGGGPLSTGAGGSVFPPLGGASGSDAPALWFDDPEAEASELPMPTTGVANDPSPVPLPAGYLLLLAALGLTGLGLRKLRVR